MLRTANVLSLDVMGPSGETWPMSSMDRQKIQYWQKNSLIRLLIAIRPVTSRSLGFPLSMEYRDMP